MSELEEYEALLSEYINRHPRCLSAASSDFGIPCARHGAHVPKCFVCKVREALNLSPDTKYGDEVEPPP